MKRCFFFFFIFIVNAGFSQVIINGQINNSKGLPIPFASIYLQMSQYGTVSNENGGFELQIKGEAYSRDTLVVSFVGYKTIKKAVNLTKSSSLSLTMQSSVILLDEVNVNADKKKILTALQIVKKAISHTKDNYINTSYTAEGFYRETILENDVFVKINEAAVRFNFSKYPQKHFFKGGFKKYWSDYWDSYVNLHKSAGFPGHAQVLPYYNSKHDAAKIMASRYSSQNSQFKGSVNPAGGPLDITGNDKLKFQYDFLDSKRFKDYEFHKEGVVEYNNEWCYKIRFNPKKQIGRYHHNYGKKIEYAVYSGQIIVSIKDFSVHQISCQRIYFDSNNGSYFRFLHPVNITLQLDYRKTANGMMLVNAASEQEFVYNQNGISLQFEIVRELWISDSLLNTIKEVYPWEERLDLTTNSTIEDYTESYDQGFWRVYEKRSLFKPLSNKAINDLERYMPLEQQFKSQFIPIDSIPVPKCEQKDGCLTVNGDSLQDNYRWLEAKSEQTVDYIEKENKYYNQIQNQLKKYKKEFIGRVNFILKKDTTAASPTTEFNGFRLMSKKIDDSLRIFQIMNDSSKKQLFNYKTVARPNILWNTKFSDSLSFVAYDYNKDFSFARSLVLKNVNSNKSDTMLSVCDFVWLNDSIIVYTSTNLPGKYPANEVHWYNAVSKQDWLLFNENDNTRELGIVKSASNKMVIIRSVTKDDAKIFFLNQELQLNQISASEQGEIFEANHFADNTFLCVLNYNKLYKAPLKEPSVSKGELIYGFDEFQTIISFNETKNYYLVTVFEVGVMKLFSIDKRNKKASQFDFNEDFFSLDISKVDYSTDHCTVSFESPVTPIVEYEFDIKTKDRIKTTAIIELSQSVNPDFFEVKQTFAKTDDGEKVPITYLNRKYIKEKKGTILKVYGAYGATHAKGFLEVDLALADLGFIVAYAQVRGGMDKGINWYLEGKHLNKKNSVNDYIACAKHLIDEGLATDSTLVGYGSSAGGVVVGAAVNKASELFNTVILDRAFLDVLTTQSDETLALTTVEYSEIGNPKDSVDYAYIKSYCPYLNISQKNYPNILYLGGINDCNVNYWNALKHLASVREKNQSESIQLIQLGDNGHNISWTKATTDFADIYAFLMYNLVEIKL